MLSPILQTLPLLLLGSLHLQGKVFHRHYLPNHNLEESTKWSPVSKSRYSPPNNVDRNRKKINRHPVRKKFDLIHQRYKTPGAAQTNSTNLNNGGDLEKEEGVFMKRHGLFKGSQSADSRQDVGSPIVSIAGMSFSDFATSLVQNIGSGLLWLNLFAGNEMKHESETRKMNSILSKLDGNSKGIEEILMKLDSGDRLDPSDSAISSVLTDLPAEDSVLNLSDTREEDDPIDEEELEDLAYFENLLNEIVSKKRRIKRSKAGGEKEAN